MTECSHKELLLIPEKKGRLRCRNCHLTIAADELGDDCCPECYEADGTRRYDFESVASENTGTAVYRCEACGITIECE